MGQRFGRRMLCEGREAREGQKSGGQEKGQLRWPQREPSRTHRGRFSLVSFEPFPLPVALTISFLFFNCALLSTSFCLPFLPCLPSVDPPSAIFQRTTTYGYPPSPCTSFILLFFSVPFYKVSSSTLFSLRNDTARPGGVSLVPARLFGLHACLPLILL